MSGMNDLDLQLKEIRGRIHTLETYLILAGIMPPKDPAKDDHIVVQPHWAFEDPEADNKWRV